MQTAVSRKREHEAGLVCCWFRLASGAGLLCFLCKSRGGGVDALKKCRVEEEGSSHMQAVTTSSKPAAGGAATLPAARALASIGPHVLCALPDLRRTRRETDQRCIRQAAHKRSRAHSGGRASWSVCAPPPSHHPAAHLQDVVLCHRGHHPLVAAVPSKVGDLGGVAAVDEEQLGGAVLRVLGGLARGEARGGVGLRGSARVAGRAQQSVLLHAPSGGHECGHEHPSV